MKRFQRIISFVLAFVLMLGTVPVTVRAEETEPMETVAETTAPAEETTMPAEAEPTENTTVPTEAAAEPMEGTTAPVEETTVPVMEPETAETVASISQEAACSVSGTYGDSVTWTYLDGVLTISGSGRMDGNSYDSTPWEDYKSSITTVIVEEGITVLDSYAFLGCSKLTSLSLPGTLKEIESYAFVGCGSLRSVTVPSNVAELGDWAFANSSLEEIRFEGYAPVCGYYVFANIVAAVYYPEGHVGTSWEKVMTQDHKGTITWKIWTPDDSTLTGTCCDTIIWSLDGMGTMTISGEGALDFYSVQFAIPWENYREQILSLVVEQGITSIETLCFADCINLTTVQFADTVSSLGQKSFRNCSSLEEIIFPETISYIGSYAFQNCAGLDRVYIPETTGVGSFLFDGTYGLTIYHGSKKPIYTTWNYNYNNESYIDTYYGWSRHDYSFWLDSGYKDRNATEISLPDGIRIIPDYAFDGLSKLVRVDIPEGVVKIGRYAFSGTALASIDLPSSLEEIGVNAFYSCKFTSITIPAATASIPKGMLQNCPNLTSITVEAANETYCSVDGVMFSKDGKKLLNFPRAKSAAFYVVPADVEEISNNAFQYAKNCKGLILPEGLIAIRSSAFADSGITFLNIPKNVQSIGAYVADNSALTDVYFDGTEEEWNAIDIATPNDGLLNAMRKQETLASSGTCGEGVKWELLGETLHIYGSGAMWDYASADTVPWKLFRDEITRISIGEGVYRVGEYAFAGCKNMTILQVPSSLNSVGSSALEGCRSISQILDLSHKENMPQRYFGSLNLEWGLAEHILLGMKDYVTNSDIRINRAGKAWAYYAGIPNETYVYSVGETSAEAEANEDGIVKIPLGGFGAPGTYPVTVKISKVGDHVLTPAMELHTNVTVTPLLFTQEWQVSFSKKVGAELLEGMELLAAKVSLGSVGGELGRGNTIGISRTYSEEGETLTLTSDMTTDGTLKGECGITGKVLEAELAPAKAAVGVQAKSATTYGLKFSNYSPDDGEQNMAVAAFFLGEIIEANASMLYLDPLYRALAENVYDPGFCTVINGSSASLAASAGADLGALKINEVSVFPGVMNAGGETSVTVGIKKDTAGETEKSTNYLTTYDLSNTFADAAGKLGHSFLGKDTTVAVTKVGEETELEATSLLEMESGFNHFIQGECYTADYNSYIFRDEALRDLKNEVENVDKYITGDRKFMTKEDVGDIANFVSTSELPLPYDKKVKEQMLRSYPLEIGLGAGVALEAGMTLSYLTSTDYSAATGFAKDDEIWLTAESIELQGAVNSTKEELGDFIQNAMNSIAGLAADMFETFAGSVREGVDGAVSWVAGKADSAYNWVVTIVSGQKDTAGSRTMNVYRARSAASLSAGITAEEGQMLSDAVTIGIATILKVTDGDTGEEIMDLSVQPLEYSISYTEEDLLAAGLSSQSEVVRNGGIAMYRYDEEMGCFAFVEGTHDPENRTVTANILQPGQYVLMVDACAPTISALGFSDLHPTPTITASIYDLTGMDQDRFVFCVDGEPKITGENLSAHYNEQTGRFTYTVSESEALAEGAHTVSFTLGDLTGNVETYEYRFQIDTNAPMIAEVTANGKTNAGSVVQIRAKVTDEALSGVYTVFSRKLPGGEWSETVSVPMSDMGEGFWGVDYEGDGSLVKIYVEAIDAANNTAISKTLTANPSLEGFALKQEYLALRPGQTVQLQADVQPAALAELLTWSVEQEEEIIAVDDSGNVTAQAPGTAYVLAAVSVEDVELTARCRVDVAETEVADEVEKIRLDGIQLGSTKLTTELYSTDYAEFEVLLKLPQNHSIAGLTASSPAAMSSAEAVDTSPAIDSARFTDETVDSLFAIEVLDDRRVQIVPRADTAIANPKAVKSKYSSTVTVTVQGREWTSEEVLTLTVKKTMPKLKATVAAFNSFYPDQSRPIVITGGTITGIRENAETNTKKTTAIPQWLTLEDGVLMLNENAPARSVSGKAYLLVDTEEWRIPAALTLSVKNAYKAPKLKLSASTVTVNRLVENRVEVGVTADQTEYTIAEHAIRITGEKEPDELAASCENGILTIETTDKTPEKATYKLYFGTPGCKEAALTVKVISAKPSVTFKAGGSLDLSFPEKAAAITPTFKNYNGGFTIAAMTAENAKKAEVDSFRAVQDGKRILIACDEAAPTGAYTLTLRLSLEDGSFLENTVRVTVKRTAVKLKLAASKVTMNKDLRDVAEVGVTCTTEGYGFDLAEAVLTYDESVLNVARVGGNLVIMLKDGAEYGKTYPVSVSAAYQDAPEVKLSVAVAKQNAVIKSTIKATGSLDVIRDDTAITVKPAYTNVTHVDVDNAAVLKIYSSADKFKEVFATVRAENGIFSIDDSVITDHSLKYKAQLETDLYRDKEPVKSNLISLSVKMGSTKLTVKVSDTTLFAKDKNDRALIRFEAKDATLNDVVKVEIKDAKQAAMFEIVNYRNGVYAIGFKDGNVDTGLVGKAAAKSVTVTLNIFIDGNESTKANTTAKVKLTIVK